MTPSVPDASRGVSTASVTVKCPSCNGPVAGDLPFCGQCGTRLTQARAAHACGRCGRLNDQGFKFCPACGAAFSDTGPQEAVPAAPLKSGAAAPQLALLDRTGQVAQRFPLQNAVTTLGRQGADINFPDDDYLSPLHAQFLYLDGILTVRDLGSKNGTWLYLEEPHKLSDGDLVLLGSQILRFRRLGYPGPRPPEQDQTRRLGSLTPAADIANLAQLRADGSPRDMLHLSPGRTVAGRPGAGRLAIPLRFLDERTPRPDPLRGRGLRAGGRGQPQRRGRRGARRAPGTAQRAAARRRPDAARGARMKVCPTCGAEYGDEKLFCQRDGTPLRKSGAASDLVGKVIADRYHIIKKLGEGGMGQVYLAEHVKMGRRSAIKVMNPGMMSDPEAISRFNREAANASRISHPNVCAIYDFGETPDGLIYLAMEFIEGKSLTDLLTEGGILPLARAATIIQQTAEALQVAHDLGIVHRDLKPDNIMVSTARGKDMVKVVDFGIAKAIGGDDGKAQKVTKTGLVVGTPEYMSPEQLAGDKVDGRSDLYSLGLVFYRMLTGASPFPADSQQETMIKRLTDDPMPLAVARPDVTFPPEVQRVLDRALARNPNERYRSASEFAREIRGLSTHATGQVDVEAGTQKVRPEDLKAAMPATRVDPAGGALRPKAAPGSEPPSTRPAKKGIPAVPVAIAVLLLAAGGGAIAMRDRLFGGAAAVVPDSATTPPRDGEQAGDSARAQPFSHPDTTTRTPDPGAAARPAPPGRRAPAHRHDRPGGEQPDPAGFRAQTTAGWVSSIPDIAGSERRAQRLLRRH